MVYRKTNGQALTHDEMDANFEELETKSNLMLGVGQTWQDVAVDRDFSITYTNSTQKPIFISILLNGSLSNRLGARFLIDDVIITDQLGENANGDSETKSIDLIIPINSTYRLENFLGTNVAKWYELR